MKSNHVLDRPLLLVVCCEFRGGFGFLAALALRGHGNDFAFGALAAFATCPVLAFTALALRGRSDDLAFGALAAFAAGAHGSDGLAHCSFHAAAVLATALARASVTWANPRFHATSTVNTTRSASAGRCLGERGEDIGETFRSAEARGSSDRGDGYEQSQQSDTTIELLHDHFPLELESKTRKHFRLLESVTRWERLISLPRLATGPLRFLRIATANQTGSTESADLFRSH